MRSRAALVGALSALALALLAGSAQAAAPIVVNSTADTNGNSCPTLGTCTLREAINQANLAGGGTIYFEIGTPGTSPDIQPLSPLPAIYTKTTLDGTTQGAMVQLDGTNVTAAKNKPAPDGLLITGGNATVEGLEITNWKGNGIELQTSGFNTIEDDYLGNDGSSAEPDGNGIEVDNGSGDNTIGGTSSSDMDVISGNTGSGVLLTGKGVSTNTVEGDYIGTDSTGKNPLGNGYDGVDIVDGADGNTIGGTSSGDRDVISGNDPSGDHYDQLDIGGADGNFVEGDYIGPNETGTSSIPNKADGVYIYDGATGNTIGGTASGAGNVISGNADEGVSLYKASGNPVEGNYIGTDESGSKPLGNSGDGVDIGGASNDTIGPGNVISDNKYDGVYLYDGATKNTVEGDYIGTDSTGENAIGNGDAGVYLYKGVTHNTIGGTSSSARDVISANNADNQDYDGVDINDAPTNTVEGDYIGTDADGTKSLGGQEDGVDVENGSSGNTIGGTASGAGNVISGNNNDGLWIGDKGTSKNVVEGDYIGTDESGSNAVPNDYNGVQIVESATENTVSSDVISGNAFDGVDIENAGTSKNVVEGDYIGTNGAGTSALGNAHNGVFVGAGATENTIGGTASGAADVLSGNGEGGVEIDGNGTSKNVVEGDYIGTNSSSSAALGNVYFGVAIYEGATANTIGGPAKGARDVISGNDPSDNYYGGVDIEDSGTTKNVVQGDYIGTNTSGTGPLGNGPDGVFVADGATGDTIGGTGKGDANTIDYNDNNGVEVSGSSTTGIPIETNSIFDNTGLAIALTSGGNDDQPAPTVTAVSSSGSGKTAKTTITGTVPASKDSLRIEVFASPSCATPPAPGQGQVFLGATSASKGAWKLTVAASALVGSGDIELAATSTDTKTLDTSEFSPCLPIE